MHLECQTCGASLLVDPNHRTAICPYCASPSVIEAPPSVDRPLPHFVLGFTLSKDSAQGAVKGWLGKRSFFAPSSVKSGSVDSIRGVYVPAYLYSAMAQSQYSAQIGENYQETETYTTRDANGNLVTRTRTVTKTEYRHLAGAHATYVLDVLVTASRAIPNAELEAIEPFDLRMMRRYTPAMISGWIAEEPTMTQNECYGIARQEAMNAVSKALTAFMPGDSHQALSYQTQLDQETTELVYVPIWILAIRHDPAKPTFRVLINGQTGAIYGKAPLSWIRIVLVILAVLALLATPFVIDAIAGDPEPPRRPASGAVTATAPAALAPAGAPTAKAATPVNPVPIKPAPVKPAPKPAAPAQPKPTATGGRTR